MGMNQAAAARVEGAVSAPLVVGVTSHRNIPPHEEEAIRACVRRFLDGVRAAFPDLPLWVLSALAEGGDQWVAEEALAVGATLVAALPMPADLYERDFDDPAARARFHALCQCAQVVQLPLRNGHSRRAVGPPGVARDHQYAQAGVYIASHCHVLLAVWDGKESSRLGGTAQVVRYHLAGEMPGFAAHGRQRLRVLGGDERLLLHVACSREGPDGAPADGLQPGQAWWYTGDTRTPASGELPHAARFAFERMAAFNRDAARHAEAIARAARASPAPRLFHAADWLANHYRRRVLLAMRLTYGLAALMGIAFVCYSDLPAQDGMIHVFLLLFALGVAVGAVARRRDWHRRYLDYRVLAEGLRVQWYWRRARLTVEQAEFAQDTFLQQQDPELAWIRDVMRAASLDAHRTDTPEESGGLAEVIDEWVGEPGGSGQLHYYECRAAERERLHRATSRLGTLSLWTGIAISVFLALRFRTLDADMRSVLVALMGVVSILAAVREAYAFRKADKELVRQYRAMARLFAAARRALDLSSDAATQRGILRTLGEAALAEHAGWSLVHRERPLESGRP
jgi:hypothetical protein